MAVGAEDSVDGWAVEGSCMKQYWTSPGNCGFKIPWVNVFDR